VFSTLDFDVLACQNQPSISLRRVGPSKCDFASKIARSNYKNLTKNRNNLTLSWMHDLINFYLYLYL
jgi:hypothetical protein